MDWDGGSGSQEEVELDAQQQQCADQLRVPALQPAPTLD